MNSSTIIYSNPPPRKPGDNGEDTCISEKIVQISDFLFSDGDMY